MQKKQKQKQNKNKRTTRQTEELKNEIKQLESKLTTQNLKTKPKQCAN